MRGKPLALTSGEPAGIGPANTLFSILRNTYVSGGAASWITSEFGGAFASSAGAPIKIAAT